MIIKKKLITLSLICIFIILISNYVINFLKQPIKEFSPVVEIDSIEISNAKLYLKKITWGLKINHSIRTISDNLENLEKYNVFEIEKSMIYKGDVPIFYIIEKDSVYLYVDKPSFVPDNLKHYNITQIVKSAQVLVNWK